MVRAVELDKDWARFNGEAVGVIFEPGSSDKLFGLIFGDSFDPVVRKISIGLPRHVAEQMSTQPNDTLMNIHVPPVEGCTDVRTTGEYLVHLLADDGRTLSYIRGGMIADLHPIRQSESPGSLLSSAWLSIPF